MRVPFLIAWPGKIKDGTVNDHVAAFWDFLPTAAEVAGGKAPPGVDGLSFLPTLMGKEQKHHEYLYWEFYEGGFQQAARLGKWKAVRPKLGGPIELYDLDADLGEKMDVAARNQAVVARVEEVMRTAHTDSPDWPVKAGRKK